MREPEPRRATWTATELVAVAAAHGLSASQRLIRYWEDVGLLDRPVVRGRGPRRGVAKGVWPDNQRELFLALLAQRQRRGVARNGPLCNLVVWLWLTAGDDYVPLRQAGRALKTWVRIARHPPVREADRTARFVVNRIADPSAPRRARRRLRELIARGQAGEPISWAALVTAAQPALDPNASGKPRGPAGAQLTPARYGDHVAAAVTAADGLLAGSEGLLRDELWEAARELYRVARRKYATEWERLAADPDLGHLHSAPDLEDVVNSACKDLTIVLGLLLRAQDWRRRRPPRRTTRDQGGSAPATAEASPETPSS